MDGFLTRGGGRGLLLADSTFFVSLESEIPLIQVNMVRKKSMLSPYYM